MIWINKRMWLVIKSLKKMLRINDYQFKKTKLYKVIKEEKKRNKFNKYRYIK